MSSKASSLRYSPFAILFPFLFGCQTQETSASLQGRWRFVFSLQGRQLPFDAEIAKGTLSLKFHALNGSERITAERFEVNGDSVFIQLPIFDTEFRLKRVNGSRLEGLYFDHSRSGKYQIPVVATKGELPRFSTTRQPTIDASGRWRVLFSPSGDNQYEAVGEFIQKGADATGTFLTTTGDYRYLAGNVSGDSLYLSCFDGSHVFLFEAAIAGSEIHGDFWSGTHWTENWSGERDSAATLPDATTLTYLKPGYDKVDFHFSDLDGNEVSLSDARFEGKVVIVQLMGSWCPNCTDETAYLVQLHRKFSASGLEVVAVGFERSSDAKTNLHSLKRLRDHFGVPYPILLAGKASKTEAAEKLPMLNHVLSFPTTIFIDRKGTVRRIHTGFSGPGTGEYYHEFVEQTDQFVNSLLIE
jgi:peroxiredoxin